jgi:hypothetical protein
MKGIIRQIAMQKLLPVLEAEDLCISETEGKLWIRRYRVIN